VGGEKGRGGEMWGGGGERYVEVKGEEGGLRFRPVGGRAYTGRENWTLVLTRQLRHPRKKSGMPSLIRATAASGALDRREPGPRREPPLDTHHRGAPMGTSPKTKVMRCLRAKALVHTWVIRICMNSKPAAPARV